MSTGPDPSSSTSPTGAYIFFVVEGFDLHLFQGLLLHDFFVFLLHITFFLLQVFMRIPGCHPARGQLMRIHSRSVFVMQ